MLNSNLESLSDSIITKVVITNGSISSGVLVVTDYIPNGKNAFAFIITGGELQSHTAHIWKNLSNGAVNVTFRPWAEYGTIVSTGKVSGILLCI